MTEFRSWKIENPEEVESFRRETEEVHAQADVAAYGRDHSSGPKATRADFIRQALEWTAAGQEFTIHAGIDRLDMLPHRLGREERREAEAQGPPGEPWMSLVTRLECWTVPATGTMADDPPAGLHRGCGEPGMARRQRDQARAVRTARAALADNIVVFDTETTGLGMRDEIIEISCVNGRGEVLLDTYVKPSCPISPGAAEVNGITPADLEGAPTMSVLMDRLEPILAEADAIASYNLDFDARLLLQSVGLGYRLPASASRLCIMRTHAAYRAEWNPDTMDYRWHPLARAMQECAGRARATPHGSLQNALGALEVLKHIARNGEAEAIPAGMEGESLFCRWPSYPAA